MLPGNYGYGDSEASAYSGMNEYGAAAASDLFSSMPEQTALTPQQDRPRMRVVPNRGEYGYEEFVAERSGVIIPDRSAYGDGSEYGKADPKVQEAKAIAAMALRQPKVTRSSSADDIKTLQRALNTARSGSYKLKASGKIKDGVDGNWGSDTAANLQKAQFEADIPRLVETSPELWAWLLSPDKISGALAVKAIKGAKVKAGAGQAGLDFLGGALDSFTRTLAPPPAADVAPVSGDGGGGSGSGETDWMKWGLIAGGVVLAGVVIWAIAKKD